MCHMYPDLMGSPGLKLELHISKSTQTFDDLIMGHCLTCIFFCYAHPLSVGRMPPNRGVDRSGILQKTAVNHPVIDTGKTVGFDLFSKCLVRAVFFCHDQKPAGVLINPMDNSWSDHTIDA